MDFFKCNYENTCIFSMFKYFTQGLCFCVLNGDVGRKAIPGKVERFLIKQTNVKSYTYYW